MLLFSLEKFRYLVRAILLGAKLEQSFFNVRRFPNQELFLTIKSKVANQECCVLGTIAPPDENLLTLLLLSHTLKKEGAKKVVALLPYLGYARQDKPMEKEGSGLAWIGSLLASAGIDTLVTVDLHNPKSTPLLKLPVISLESSELFAAALRKDKTKFDSILAPDEGARERCEQIRKAWGLLQPVAYCKKERGIRGVRVSAVVGKLFGPRILIHDDILDTGETLIAAAEAARRAGTREITIAITHGLFTGSAWRKLWSLGVKKIYVSDSLPSAKKQAGKNIKIVSLAPLLKNYLQLPHDAVN